MPTRGRISHPRGVDSRLHNHSVMCGGVSSGKVPYICFMPSRGGLCSHAGHNKERPRPNWDKLTSSEISDLYTIPLEDAIRVIPLRDLGDFVASPSLIDVHLKALTDAMTKVASDNLPHKRFASHETPAWSDRLKVAQRGANFAYKQWKAAGRPRNDDHPVRASYKKAKGQFRACLRLHRKEQREEFYTSLNLHSTNSKKLFRDIRRANGHVAESIPHLSFNGTTYTGNDILTGWGSYFSKLATPSPNDNFDSTFQSNILHDFQQLASQPPSSHISLTINQIVQAVKSLSPHKAAGPDGIAPEHLLYACPLLMDHLCILFNAILATCHVPSSFLVGYVIPIPKGHDKDLSIPSNHRGISTLSNVSKVFEKIILDLISPTISINPLQGGFRPGRSCLHTAFIFQESIQYLRDQKKKAYVAFLDVSKAFDTVWHEGLLVKLHRKGIPHRLWHLINNSYSDASSSVLYSGSHSHSFPLLQGVRQGAILSPLLYSVFVDELLDILSESGHGVMIGDNYCGAPMYADDLALIADSPEDLQAMLDIVSSYAHAWRYTFNAQKSAVLVFGEAPRCRAAARNSRRWTLDGAVIQESNEYHHLGVLRTVNPSSFPRTSERCTAGRSAFFALNGVGSRFGCLHPITSYRLYQALCLPITLYGSELWSLTKTELLMLERAHSKILRTIQGLPTRCPLPALRNLLGSQCVSSYIAQRQLAFVNSIATMNPSALPRRLLEYRISCNPTSGCIPEWSKLLSSLNLPSIIELLHCQRTHSSWKISTRRLLSIQSNLSLTNECSNLPIGLCDLPLGKPAPHWAATLADIHRTRRNNFRIRLLTGCDGLEADASRFRLRRNGRSPNDPSCKLCGALREDSLHFVASCPALREYRNELIGEAPSSVKALLPDPARDPHRFFHVMSGVEWISDIDFQLFCIDFLDCLRSRRNALAVSPDT